MAIPLLATPAAPLEPRAPGQRVNSLTTAPPVALSGLPVEVPKPILARLPPSYETNDDPDEGYESEGAEADESDSEPRSNDVQVAGPAVEPGDLGSIAVQPQGYLVHRDRAQVLYTHARLPHLGLDEPHAQASLELWKALHNFHLVVSPTEVAAGFWASLQYDRMVREPKVQPPPGSTLYHLQHSFNWSSLRLPRHLEGQWYGVAFRSARAHTPKPGTHTHFLSAASVTEQLYTADRLAHEEAVDAGGLLVYWYAVPTPQGENLATCIWTDRDAARLASQLPAHRLATAVAAQAFDAFSITRYTVRKRVGQSGVQIEPWVD